MNDNIIKQPPLPDAIQFHTTRNDDMPEVMRITRDGIWVNPDMQVDETAKAVLDALGYQVNVLVQKAVEEEREACAKFIEDNYVRQFESPWREDLAEAIRARGNHD